jgi:hypothetical protein
MSLAMPEVRAIQEREGSNSVRAYLQLLPVSLLCWSAVVILESGQVFVADAAHGYSLPAMHYMAWAIFNWYGLALLTPVIYQLARRYPITGPNWAAAILFPHLTACFGWMAAGAVLRGAAGWLYTLSHETEATPIQLAAEWVGRRGLLALIGYWIIVIAAGIAHLREQMRQRELRQAHLEARLASAELEKLRMQIQPHFLFNTLQAAITLIHDDPQAAEDVLLRLSELLRISLDQMETNEIPLARELEFLDLYTGIQRRRFGDRLDVAIRADAETLDLLVPPLILQPLVENAIRHGIGKHKGGDSIEVFAHLEGGRLEIEVWNGNSVVEEQGEGLFRRGMGLRNTRARLLHLYGPAGRLIFRALAKGGAAALISIPARPSKLGAAHAPAEAAR